MYIVKYSSGIYEDFCEINLFVTKSKKVAEDYVIKFNNLLTKLKNDLKRFEDENGWYDSDKFGYDFFDRWDKISEINECYYQEINER